MDPDEQCRGSYQPLDAASGTAAGDERRGTVRAPARRYGVEQPEDRAANADTLAFAASVEKHG